MRRFIILRDVLAILNQCPLPRSEINLVILSRHSRRNINAIVQHIERGIQFVYFIHLNYNTRQRGML